jgi:hypothetical protein
MLIAFRRGVEDQFGLKKTKVRIRYEREYGASGSRSVGKARASIVQAFCRPSSLRAEV